MIAFPELVGCGSYFVPLAVRSGSTVAMAVPAGGYTGYGGSLLANMSPPIFDDQRGELVFRLSNGSGTYDIQPLYVTRVAPDSASKTGIAEVVDLSSIGLAGTFNTLGQPLAVLNIPTNVTPGPYDVTILRRFRSGPGTPPQWNAPIAGNGAAGQLEVLTGTGAPTPIQGFIGGFTLPDVSGGLRDLYPYPAVSFLLPTLSLPGNPLPSAAHIVIGYQPQKLSVKSVYENDRLGRRSILTWSANPTTGTVTIDLVNADLTRAAGSVAIAFDLLNPFGSPPNGGVAVVADFSVLSVALYDTNGVLRISNPALVTPGEIR